MITPLTEDEVDRQITALRDSIRPKLTANELQTFEIRPSVSHGDIEVFLNGRLYYVDGLHFRKVLDSNVVESYVIGLLPRLRGKRYIWSAQNAIYDLQKVQKEINYVLVNLCDAAFPNKEQDKIDQDIEKRLHEVCNLEKEPEEYTAEHYTLINRLLFQELVNYLRKCKRNG